MGLFGYQLVVTMIVTSAIHKLSKYYSFGRWLLVDKLKFYCPPSQRDLQQSSRSSKINGTKDEVYVLKNCDLYLKTSQITLSELLSIHYYSDFRWLVDFTASASLVYVCTRAYFYFHPTAMWSEYDLSAIWISLVLLYNIGALFSITAMYFTNDLSTERSLCMVFTAFFLVCAMAILIVDERTLEFGLDGSYDLMVESFVNVTGVNEDYATRMFPNWLLKSLMALLASMIGGLVTFPGFRCAQMHHGALARLRKRPFYRIVHHINYILPMVIISLWITPLTRTPLTTGDFPVMTNEQFNQCKVLLLHAACILRVSLIWPHLQAYLELAKHKVQIMRSGKERVLLIQLQKKVLYILKFLCAVGLQYTAPLILLLTLTMLYNIAQSRQGSPYAPGIGVFSGCLSFLCWWVNFTWIITTTCGSIEHTFSLGHILA